MKDREKEEVKEIVRETIKEQQVNTQNEIKKEKKSKKKVIIISSIIGGLLLITALVFLFMFILKPTYKVTVNSGGGKITKGIVIEDNTIKELPTYIAPEGKKLVTWVNKKGEAVRTGIKLEGDDTLDPILIPEPTDPTEYVKISFETGTDEVIPSIEIIKGMGLILPVKPNNYRDWEFLYWVDKNGYIALIDTPVNEDITLYAYWRKPEEGKKVTISFDTGTDEKIDSITVVEGSTFIFPKPKKQKGNLVFKGWLDEDGNLLTSESKVTKDITLKAKWVEPYTCPENCTPNEDGKTCTKTNIVAPSEESICEGTEYLGYCVDSYNISDMDCVRQCSDGEPFGDTEVSLPVPSRYIAEYDAYSEICCAKKIDRVTKYTCPAGYERDGDNCKLVETINCTQN